MSVQARDADWRGEVLGRCAQREFVADGAEAGDGADGDVGEIGVVAERLPGVHVAQVHLR